MGDHAAAGAGTGAERPRDTRGDAFPLLIHLFGPFEARLHGQPLPRLHSRKVQWLLALLVLRSPASGYPRAVERAWLAGTLWPDSSEEAAAASLRNSLKDLRRALGPEAGRLLSPTTRSLSLNLEGAHADVLAFDTAIAQGDPAALERAVELYRGSLLEGCVEEWAFQERQNREQAYLMALETLATQAMDRGDLGAAERHLQRAVAAEPLRETAQRTLMKALAAGGNYAAATQVYRELRLRLHRELNAAPDPETQALYQQLRAEAGARGQGSGVSRVKCSDTGAVRLVFAGPDPRPLTPHPSGTVTFFFTDIEGSSQLWERYPQEMREALQHHDCLLRRSIEGHDGLIFKTVGDAFYATFATAPAALAAALAAQQALQVGVPLVGALSDAQGHPQRAPLRVRMALHTGLAEAREGDYFGPTLNRVARLLDAAHGGQVLLSLPTEELARDALPEGVGLRSLGEHRLKDLVRPEQVFQLLHPDLPSVFPPLRSLEAFAHNLPLQWTSFIGREQEMEAVKQLLPATPLLTLSGAGGCGKTRLALQVAADLLEAYPDGVWLVDLAALAEPTLVPQAVATALGVPEQPGRPLTATLIEHLRTRSLLLVLDNCEHLLAACGELVDTLLRACLNLRILATSRERLGLTGERVYLVPSLSLPELLSPAAGEGASTDTRAAGTARNERKGGEEVAAALRSEAVRLFAERAVYTQPQFALTAQNVAVVAQLCRRLDGIPLALELAAARVKALSVEQIADRLDDAFRLLTGGSRTALPRQQTLRATIDWSYDLLSEPEKTLLRRLSVFAGGWSLEAAEAVCSGEAIDEWEILDLLALLVEKSLVLYEEGPLFGVRSSVLGKADPKSGHREPNTEPRYRLLETVRQYARDRRREAGETEAACGRHRDCFLRLAEAAEPELRRHAQIEWLDRLEREHDNLRAALEWCQAQGGGAAGLRLTAALSWFWMMRNHFREGRQWLDKALSIANDGPLSLRAQALAGAAQLAVFGGDRRLGERLAGECLPLAREAGEEWVVAWILYLLGDAAVERGDFSHATEVGEEGLAMARGVGDRWLIAMPLLLLGHAARGQGKFEVCTTLFTECLSLLREVGDRWARTFPLLLLGATAVAQGDYQRATRYSREAMALSYEMADTRGIVWSFHVLARVAVEQEQAERAARLSSAAEALREVSGCSIPPGMQAWFEYTQEKARAALPENVFDAAWADGRAMTPEQAMDYALMEPPHEE